METVEKARQIEFVPYNSRSYGKAVRNGVRCNLESLKAALSQGQREFWYQPVEDGPAHRVRVNGQLREWKRTPGKIRLPMKYGFKECFWIDEYTISNLILEIF